ncbi:putative Root UVB sensitive family [Lupinus albus]|uniref:Putative Root UVB sensitive family n=1 Tax=Lupinus albus TaxID=3870 RepID=A0A6A4NS41_LUPAL|nr:putative Root UVB sensitive family [Lupinus albus]
MSQTLQLSFSSTSSGLSSSLKLKRTRTKPFFFQILCSSSKHSSFKDEDVDVNEGDRGLSRVILVERYSNGTAKRYVLDDDSQLQTFLVEEDRSTTKKLQDSHFPDKRLSWLPKIIKDFILPAGFPGSVSDDYLNYMLLQFPTNVTGWICHTLAVGVGSFSGSTAAASAAAIRWLRV